MKFHLDMPSCGTASRSFRGNAALYDTGSSGAGAGPGEFFGGGLRVMGGGEPRASAPRAASHTTIFVHPADHVGRIKRASGTFLLQPWRAGAAAGYQTELVRRRFAANLPP